MNRPLVLVVDDEPDIRELLKITLNRMEIDAVTVENLRQARAALGDDSFDFCLTDMRLPDGSGIDLVRFIQQHHSEIPVAVITAHGNMESAVASLKAGAFDFVSKPVDLQVLRNLVSTALRLSGVAPDKGHLLVGDSLAMRNTKEMIVKLARSQAPIYISGESGTGKELVARLIHGQSARVEKPFIPVNCGAIPADLMESELFGHKKGSFTGAFSDKLGLFQAAEGGTLFLDEVADLPLAMQVKLLRAIQEQQITRVGGVKPIDIDVRFVVASNQILEDMVKEGRFRADLFHRINVVKIVMPPLRERPEDIPLLIKHFVNLFAGRYNREITGFDSASIKKLEQYAWPGNVRELRNLVEHHVVLADGSELSVGPLPETSQPADLLDDDFPTLAELEQRYVKKVMAHFDGNRKMVAEALGIDKSTLWRKLQQYE